MTTLRALPPRDSAKTLLVVLVVRRVSVATRRDRPAVATSCWPVSSEVPTTGASAVKPAPRVPLSGPETLL